MFRAGAYRDRLWAGRSARWRGYGRLSWLSRGIDFEGWRCAVDFGAYALVFDQGRLWQGASGVRLSELGDPVTPWAPTPLTLLAFAEAVVGATESGAEVVMDEECVRLRAIADLGSLVASHRPPPMPPENLPEPNAVPFDAVLTESGQLRGLRWRSAYQPLSPEWAMSDELDVIGVADSIEVDWTRMPVYQPVEDVELMPEALEEAKSA